MIDSLDRHLDAILACPTAPFRESAVLRAIDRFAAERAPRVQRKVDAAGNRILAVRGARAGRQAPTIAFTAHLDHPAFVRGGDGQWELLGRVLPECLPSAALRFFREDASPAGRGRVVAVEKRDGRILASLARDETDERGDFGTFDFPALTRAGDRLTGRVCDDLMGAIAILAAVDECLEREPTASWLAVFTRAEEVGLVGATLLVKGRALPRSVPVVGLECSAARGGNAVVGEGPIVRVGDKVATFDPDTTAFLRDCAESIAREAPGFRWQRRLMQGGTCESTVYQLDGRRSGALCLALGNYHNVPDETADAPRPGVAPEYVSRRDLEGLVRIVVRAVARSARLSDPWRETRASLARRARELRGML